MWIKSVAATKFPLWNDVPYMFLRVNREMRSDVALMRRDDIVR